MSLGLKNIVFCGVGCVMGVGIIAGNCFGIKLSENGAKTVLSGGLRGCRVFAVQTVNLSLFGQLMDCPE